MSYIWSGNEEEREDYPQREQPVQRASLQVRDSTELSKTKRCSVCKRPAIGKN
jgi:hypothetical protein